jgi:hypothetical protein
MVHFLNNPSRDLLCILPKTPVGEPHETGDSPTGALLSPFRYFIAVGVALGCGARSARLTAAPTAPSG